MYINFFNLLASMKKYVGLCPVKCLCQSMAKTFKFDVSIFLEAVKLLKAIISHKIFT